MSRGCTAFARSFGRRNVSLRVGSRVHVADELLAQASRTSSRRTLATRNLFQEDSAGPAACVPLSSSCASFWLYPSRTQFCISKRAIPFDPQHATEIDETKIKHVLAVCGVRDDARFLARLTFGISSPRITKLGLSFNPIFGSCPTADFTKLVKRFEDECEEAGGKNKEVLAPPKASGGGRGGAFNSGGGGAKRTASSGGTRGGARGGAKRGRWDK